MEALAAIALVGNALQFSQIGINVCQTGYKIAKSSTGSLPEMDGKRLLAASLSRFTSEISTTSNSVANSTAILSRNEADIQALAKACQVECQKLVDILDSLETKSPSKPWSALKKGARVVWKEKDIKAVEQTLANYRGQLVLNLMLLMNDQKSTTVASLHNLQAEHRDLQMAGNPIGDIVSQLNCSLAASRAEKKPAASLSKLQVEITQLLQERGIQMKYHSVLRTLKFNEIQDRRFAIKETYETTFDWIFMDKHPELNIDVPFVRWLKHGSSIFWIRGKPGSGKSTLMKYVVGSLLTSQYLEQWAGNCTLLRAEFFFWHSGTVMQKSQTGLLRSLLFALLSKCSSLIPLVVPDRFLQANDGEHNARSAWTRTELLTSIRKAMRQDMAGFKFCFFIDGLDEYVDDAALSAGNPHETDHSELVDLIESLGAEDNVKICVSSREWNVFDKRFASLKDSTITLEDFSKPDIRRFVQGNLGSDDGFRRLESIDPRYRDFIEDFVKRAQGVFLWVVLAVSSLRKGLNNSDDIITLQKRLQLFPPSLELYFKRMLDNVEPIYQSQSAQILLVALAADGPLPLLMYLSLDTDISPVVGDAVSTLMTEAVHDDLTQSARLRLNARCQDLLEIRPLSLDLSVEFIHRTAVDYLLKDEVQVVLKRRLREPFDANLFLCRSASSLLQDSSHWLLTGKENENLWELLITHARRVDSTFESVLTDILDSVEISNHYACLKRLPRDTAVFEACLGNNVSHYVQKRLLRDVSLVTHLSTYGVDWPTHTLDVALFGHDLGPFVSSRVDNCDLKTLELLLKLGADPNWGTNTRRGLTNLDTNNEHSIWIQFLGLVVDVTFYGYQDEMLIAKITQMLLEHGARAPYSPAKPEFSELTIVGEYLDTAHSVDLQTRTAILQMLHRNEDLSKPRSWRRLTKWLQFTRNTA